MRTAARVARSLPVRTRNATGDVHDYGDPRLLHERGLVASLEAAWLDTPAAVAGVDHERAAELCIGNPPPLPTTGASASLFALAGMADAGTTGPAGRGRAGDPVRHHGHQRQRPQIHRREPAARPMPEGTFSRRRRHPDLAGRLRAGLRGQSALGGRAISPTPTNWTSRRGTASAPTARWPPTTSWCRCRAPARCTPRPRCTSRCPGCETPYSLVIVELDGVGVRALVKVTGAEPGTVDIGDRGRLALRRVAVRSGVPDYGYAFEARERDAAHERSRRQA